MVKETLNNYGNDGYKTKYKCYKPRQWESSKITNKKSEVGGEYLGKNVKVYNAFVFLIKKSTVSFKNKYVAFKKKT